MHLLTITNNYFGKDGHVWATIIASHQETYLLPTCHNNKKTIILIFFLHKISFAMFYRARKTKKCQCWLCSWQRNSYFKLGFTRRRPYADQLQTGMAFIVSLNISTISSRPIGVLLVGFLSDTFRTQTFKMFFFVCFRHDVLCQHLRCSQGVRAWFATDLFKHPHR